MRRPRRPAMSPAETQSQEPEQSPPADDIPAKRARAKQACRECNARRVRCNVTESNPCSNCQTSGAKCEVLPSRRGRYPRKSRRQHQSSLARPPELPSVTNSDNGTRLSPTDSTQPATNQSVANLGGASTTSPLANTNVLETRLPARTPSPITDSAAPGTLFFGESNFLTLVPGRPRLGEGPSQNGDQNGSKHKARLLFPITNTPQSMPEGASPASCDRVSSGTARYLRDEGALTLPDLHTCVPALQAYFTWFHPCFPILDRAEFTRRLASFDVSYLLLQSMLFIGATYCDHDTIVSMGFKDRSEAKSLLYTRARLLFHADWEKDKLTLIQSLFLMSFWRGGPSDVRDVRYWLGVVIGVAESYGLHRSAKFATRDPHRARMRRRIWWSIYVRERQAAASLGLPSRIRDDDCDIEPLSPSDLESEVENQETTFGSCKLEHIQYAIKMVEIARILGQVIDVHFSPGRPQSTLAQVHNLDQTLESWKQSLPDELSRGVDDGNASVWSHLLHLAYNHIRILIHRHSFLKQNKEDDDGQIAVAAASRISRIAEDMLAQGTLRYGQMHLITSLFAALCIHVIGIKRGVDVTRRIAEHRAQMCLLALQEIQKYWRINNNVLDLFLQYLDVSIANRLHGTGQAEGTSHSMAILEPQTSGEGQEDDGQGTPAQEDEERYDFPTPQTRAQTKAFEDQYFNMLYGPWEGDDGVADLGLVLQADDPLKMDCLNFLGRSL
ncbi:N-terminal binuclear Zn cluster-containing/DNA binding domain-containing protein [Dactylonectria estremocensis]|uniref:N-terminal binuclear Zn cluster-containing/DNA binding domain-containing protein n=1 Tax=Dactylonectria estremocensis TaxID=1079267 RepID=A0A9P9FD69_9HYPO|nr:N-terminal binuclear Zn cluster-containing/DNA binding domain-containing protein [Dactylonectria estremocensis]